MGRRWHRFTRANPHPIRLRMLHVHTQGQTHRSHRQLATSTSAEARPQCVIAEVHHTYRGRHAYLLRPDEAGNAFADKEFCVSPFQAMDGEYRMEVPRPGSLLSVEIALRRDGKTPLTASPRGVRRPATAKWLTNMLLTRPLMPHRVSALIRRHGVTLWVQKAPITPRTPQAPQTAGGTLDG